MAEIQACRAWWREDVYEAFRRAVPAPARSADMAA
jgi:hypothetical protein